MKKLILSVFPVVILVTACSMPSHDITSSEPKGKPESQVCILAKTMDDNAYLHWLATGKIHAYFIYRNADNAARRICDQ